MRNAGYLTSNANTAWPFDEDDPRTSLDVARMFADGMATVYPGESVDEVVVRCIAVSSEGRVSFIVSKSRGGEYVSSNALCADVDYSVPYKAVRPDEAGWCSFVLDTFQVGQNAGRTFAGPFRLSPSSLYERANRVLSFILVNGGETSGKISGDVKFRAGHNMYVGSDMTMASAIAPIDDGRTGVVISAIPGEGVGRVPCASPRDCAGGEGNIVPDEQGDVVLEGDDCHQIVPMETPWTDESGVTHVSVKIIGKCTACCQCDDYVKIGDKLAEESRRVSDVYAQIKKDSEVYNVYARKFNESLYRVSAEELIVRCVAMSQNRDAGASHSINLGGSGISGSIDRAQAVLTIKNTSVCDVECVVYAQMKPQRIVMATIVRPNRSGDLWTNVVSETIDCSNAWYDDPSNDCSNDSNDSNDYDDSNDSNDCRLYEEGPAFFKSGIKVPSGSSVSITLYGARGNTVKPDRSCGVSGFVTFSWVENNPFGQGGPVPKQLVRKFTAGQQT